MGREVCNDYNYLSDIIKWTQVSFKYESSYGGKGLVPVGRWSRGIAASLKLAKRHNETLTQESQKDFLFIVFFLFLTKRYFFDSSSYTASPLVPHILSSQMLFCNHLSQQLSNIVVFGASECSLK